MSDQAWPFIFQWQQAVREHLQLSASTKLMLMMLSTYSSMDGRPCFPSQKRLARNCSKSVRTIKRNLMEARLYGFISVSRKRHKRRCQLNIYKLKMPTGQVSHKSHSPTEDVSPGADGITRWLQECTEPVIQFSMGTTPSDLFKHFGVWRQDKSFEHITGRTFFKRLTGLIGKTRHQGHTRHHLRQLL